MLKKNLYCLLLTYFFTIVACTTIYALDKKNYASVQEFISNQHTIRIFADDMPGYGNQTASYNLIIRLRDMGFKGLFQFYYLSGARDKIITLFDLPSDIPVIYHDAAKKIQFIEVSYEAWEDPTPENINAKEKLTLGLAGALDGSPYSCVLEEYEDDDKPKCNFAKIMNVANFIRFYPYVIAADAWLPLPNYMETKLYWPDQDIPTVQKDSKQKYITMPVASFNQAKDFLTHDVRGQALLTKKPALKTFMDGMENHLFNVLPTYGFTLQEAIEEKNRCQKCFPGNMLQVIAAVRYVQLTGPKDFQRPLIIPVFYDYKNESNKLLQMINSNHWGKYEKPGADNARQTIKDLSLAQSFFVADIADADAVKRIQQLRSGEILLLSLGPLPKILFDGIYNHIDTNIWPQIREGANTFNSLILTGRPHFRCAKIPSQYRNKVTAWEIGFDQVFDNGLKNQLEQFYDPTRGFCNGMKTWELHSNFYQAFGQLIIAAHDPTSPISIYFTQLKEAALKPENDRIYYALEEVVKRMQ